MPVLHEYNWSTPPARAVVDAVASVLSRDESDRADRFHFSSDRDSYVLAHGLLRLALSHRSAVDPKDWRFEPDQHGKPLIVWPPGQPVRFSLTHTRGMVACATSEHFDVGVDAESVNRTLDLMSIAKTVFSGSEYQSLISLSEAERTDRFFVLWTLKEAYVKARGLGLALPLDKFSFHLRRGHPPIIAFDPCMNDRPEEWQFQSHHFGAEHILAIAVHGSEVNISLESAREWFETLSTQSSLP